MAVKVEGIKELEAQLEKRFGKAHSQRWIDKGLIAGAKIVKKAVFEHFNEFKDTGASQREITISDPVTLNGVRTVKIYWKGPNDRFKIIHLNEFGTIKNPNPDGKGAVERALREARETYFKVVKSEVAKYLR
ncbi:hypothetical protein ERX37_05475 [Macrococcus hajekii]|uniref:HK97 gp10 family phage protein n=1 Tax=Macrococcus hajekii TaxID=198482 RepID=A0A4R6BNT4_9STAP|nr:hypothetical protein [Macrococcus hajekii]TDM03536.1 hypothetical protein ERX37_05475 [Macrococcus hajekii]GGA99637.1 hypothetical protein GCM10007190_04620 [Macrococcus hajekii]